MVITKISNALRSQIREIMTREIQSKKTLLVQENYKL